MCDTPQEVKQLDPTNPKSTTGEFLRSPGGTALFPGVSIPTQFGDLFSTPDAPPAPDYTGAAEATAQANLEFAREALQANRPDEYSPIGSRTWAQDEETGKWTSTVEYSPEVQNVIDKILATKGGLAGLGGFGVEQATQALEQPLELPSSRPEYQGSTTQLTPLSGYGSRPGFEGAGGNAPTYGGVSGEVARFQGQSDGVPQYQGPESGIPEYQGAQGPVQGYQDFRTNVAQNMMARVEQDIQRDRQATHDQLVAQGIPPGSEAYNRQMEQIDRKLTDARQQAEIAATDVAGREYQQYLSGRGAQQSEDQARFVAEMERRGMSRQDAMDLYSSQMQGRQVAQSEALDQFAADLESRGIQRQEAMDMFNAAVQTRGITQQEAKDRFAADMQRYGLGRQESLDMFNSMLAARQEERAEGTTAFQTGMQGYQQDIQDALLRRQTPLNELNAILTGAQVRTPQFGQAGQMATVPGADYLGAATAQNAYDMGIFNAEQARQNAMLQGLFSLGSAGLT